MEWDENEYQLLFTTFTLVLHRAIIILHPKRTKLIKTVRKYLTSPVIRWSAGTEEYVGCTFAERYHPTSILDMTLNYMWWWDSSPVALGNVK